MIAASHPWVIDYVGSFWNARDLAKRIQDYWHRRGFYHVRVWTEKSEKCGPATVYLTKSNIKFADWNSEAHMYD